MLEFSERQQKILDEYEKLPDRGIVSKPMYLETLKAIKNDVEIQELAEYLHDRDVKPHIDAAVNGLLKKK